MRRLTEESLVDWDKKGNIEHLDRFKYRKALMILFNFQRFLIQLI